MEVHRQHDAEAKNDDQVPERMLFLVMVAVDRTGQNRTEGGRLL